MTQYTESIIRFDLRGNEVPEYPYTDIRKFTVPLSPDYMEAWINADEWKEGEVPADYESYTFDGEQTFTYTVNGIESFVHRQGWAQRLAEGGLPSFDAMVAAKLEGKKILNSLGLSDDPSQEELVAIAQDPEASPELLSWLSRSLHYEVAVAVIENRNTDLETLLELLDMKQHRRIHYWGYFYEGAADEALDMINERFPGFDFEEEDELPKALLVGCWILENHGSYFQDETRALDWSSTLTTLGFNEATEDIVIDIAGFARQRNIDEAEVLRELRVIGDVTDEHGNKLWNLTMGEHSVSGKVLARLEPLFLDAVVWTPERTTGNLILREKAIWDES